MGSASGSFVERGVVLLGCERPLAAPFGVFIQLFFFLYFYIYSPIKKKKI